MITFIAVIASAYAQIITKPVCPLFACQTPEALAAAKAACKGLWTETPESVVNGCTICARGSCTTICPQLLCATPLEKAQCVAPNVWVPTEAGVDASNCPTCAGGYCKKQICPALVCTSQDAEMKACTGTWVQPSQPPVAFGSCPTCPAKGYCKSTCATCPTGDEQAKLCAAKNGVWTAFSVKPVLPGPIPLPVEPVPVPGVEPLPPKIKRDAEQIDVKPIPLPVTDCFCAQFGVCQFPTPCPTCGTAADQEKKCIAGGGSWTPLAVPTSPQNVKRDVDDVTQLACPAIACAWFGKCSYGPTCDCRSAEEKKCQETGGIFERTVQSGGGGAVPPVPGQLKRQSSEPGVACLCAPPLPGVCRYPPACDCNPAATRCALNGGVWKIDGVPLPVPGEKVKRQLIGTKLPILCECAPPPPGQCVLPVDPPICGCPEILNDAQAKCLADPTKIWVAKDAIPLPGLLGPKLPTETTAVPPTGAKQKRCSCFAPPPNGVCIDRPVSPCLCLAKPTVECKEGTFFTPTRTGGDCNCGSGVCSPIVPPVFCASSKCLFNTPAECTSVGGSFQTLKETMTAQDVSVSCGCPICVRKILIDVKLPTVDGKPETLGDLATKLKPFVNGDVTVVGGRLQITSKSAASGDKTTTNELVESIKSSGLVAEAQVASESILTEATRNGAPSLAVGAALVVGLLALLF